VVSTTESPSRTIARDPGAERGGDEHLVGAPRVAPRDVAAERVLAVAGREPPAQVELDVLGNFRLKLSASPGEQEHG
jgi:hypothetical protein